MKLLIIIGILVVFITVCVLVFIVSKSKFNFFDIKLKEANSDINLYLQKKKTTLNNIINIIIDLKKDNNIFDDFDQLVKKEKNPFVVILCQ